MKKIVIKTAAALLMSVLPALTASGGSVTYTATYNNNPVIGTRTLGGVTYTTVAYPGLHNNIETGVPSLPIELIRFSVPWNATGFKVSSSCRIKDVLPLSHPVSPSLVGNGTHTMDVYPLQSAWLYSDGMVEGENHIVTVAVMPMALIQGLSGDTLRMMESVNLTLSYDLSESLNCFPLVRRDTTLREKGFETARGMVVNPTDVRHNALLPSSGVVSFNLPQYPLAPVGVPATYLIVTTDELLHSMRRLAALKRQKGKNVKVVTMTDVVNDPISSDGDYFYNPVDGDSTLMYSDDAGKLRQFLKSHFLLYGTEHVLLAGSGVPYRTWSSIQTDQYFSDINGAWRWGHSDYGELAVGRLLGTTPALFDNYTDKLLRYELNPGNGERSYLDRAMYLEGFGYEYMEYAAYMEQVFDEVKYLNPENGGYELTGCDLLDSISNGNYGFYTSFCDGFPSGMRVYGQDLYGISHYLWAIDSVKVAPNVTDIEFGNGLNCLGNKDYPMIHLAQRGQTMPFNQVNGYGTCASYGESFTMGNDYGGPAFIGLTNEIDYWKSAAFTGLLIDELHGSNTLLGNTIMEAKNSLSMNVHEDAILAFNYLGDPALDMWTSVPLPYTNISVSRTDNGVTISGVGTEGSTVAYHSNDGVTGSVIAGTSTISLGSVDPNSTIMLFSHNHIPFIAPLIIQNTDLNHSQYVIATEVTMGRSVDGSRTNGDVTVKSGVEYEIEAAGEVTLAGGFTVEKGAGFAVRSACF